jgi:hypothetical protein
MGVTEDGKRCSKCLVVKGSGEFHKSKGSGDGLRGWCKDCTAENGRLWREANGERIKEQDRHYREANQPREGH